MNAAERLSGSDGDTLNVTCGDGGVGDTKVRDDRPERAAKARNPGGGSAIAREAGRRRPTAMPERRRIVSGTRAGEAVEAGWANAVEWKPLAMPVFLYPPLERPVAGSNSRKWRYCDCGAHNLQMAAT